MPKTVLLADGSVTIQRVVELTFADEDVNVISVGDGDRAIEVIARSRPDVVLADVGMPRGNGYELADYMRRQPRLAAVPILLLHGAFEAVDHAKVQAVGADGVLTKPFDPAVLIGRVKELLAFGRGGHGVEPGDTDASPTSTPAVAFAGEPARESAAESSGEALGAAPDDLPLSTPSSTPPSREADVYFEQIDKAFAALSKAPRASLPTNVHRGADKDADEREDESGVADADEGFEAHAAPAQPAHAEPAAAHLDIQEPPAAAVPSPPVVSMPAPPVALSDAFAALLEAERSDAADSPLRVSSGVSSAAPAVDPSALADQVTRRVLEQLTDRVVRETVAEIVASTAERLVREEIERIKRDIK